MTIFHDDQLDDTQIALSCRETKKVPSWARSMFFFSILNF